VPNQVYFGQQIDIMVNPWRANEGNVISADMDPVVHFKLDGVRLDQEGYFDNTNRLNGYVLSYIKSRISDQLPGNNHPEVRFRVGNAFLKETAKHCNFAGTDCWYVRTHPKIESVSAPSGYTTGGQTLTISGWGLKGDSLSDVEVVVDGVPCSVKSATLEKITCITGAASKVSF